MGHGARYLVTLRDCPVLANSQPGPRAGTPRLAHTPVNHGSLRQAAGWGYTSAALRCEVASDTPVRGVLPFAAENARSAHAPAGRGLLCAAGSTRREDAQAVGSLPAQENCFPVPALHFAARPRLRPASPSTEDADVPQ